MIQDSWKPHPGPQTEFMSRKEDVVLYQGGKGSGKSDAILIEALRQTENKNYKALIVRRTFPQLQELIDRAHTIYPRVGGKWQGDLHRFTFPSGSYVRFGHCNSEVDKQGYQGHELAFMKIHRGNVFIWRWIMAVCLTGMMVASRRWWYQTPLREMPLRRAGCVRLKKTVHGFGGGHCLGR